jgi:phosphoribosylglycinamide formyltransferase-1
MINLGILISGSGTNLQAIIDAIDENRLDAKISVVISNKENALGLSRAQNAGISTLCIPSKGKTREEFDGVVKQALLDRNVDYVVLAGFMRIVTAVLLDAFPMRVINIHPALLPSFPGVDAQKQALEYGVKFTGVTVHFVDVGMDTGPIIEQAVVPIFDDDDETTLKSRVLNEEHKLLPNVLQKISNGQIVVKESVNGGRVKIKAICC